MKKVVAALIVIFTLFNISSYFVLKAQTPLYTVYTGVVHYPLDFMTYLSLITQGKEHWFLSADLYSGETIQHVLLNWIYVLGGRIGWLLRLEPPVIYILLVAAGSVAYLSVAYFLSSLLFPKEKTPRLITYVLFLVSNAFPNINKDTGSWVFSYFFPSNNIGHPFIRLTNVPHHLLISAAILAACAAAIMYWQKKKPIHLWLLAGLGLFISSLQPLQWGLVAGVLGASGVFARWKKYGRAVPHDWKTEGIYALLPASVFGVVGIPFFFYLRHLFSLPPNDFTLAWEKQQHAVIPFIHFIRLMGPVFLVGLIGLPRIIRKLTVPSFPVILYSLVVVCLFYSPVPKILGIMNLRFLSVILIFAASYICADLIWFLANRFTPQNKTIVSWFAALLVVAITIPVTVTHLIERTTYTSPAEVNSYVPLGAFMTYQFAAKTVGPDETVLAAPLLASSFQAVTGRHVFVANQFGTIDYVRKIRETIDFFDGNISDAARAAWLKKNNISYIFTFAWTPLSLPGLELINSNGYALFYRVN
jgi:hypothetical protein